MAYRLAFAVLLAGCFSVVAPESASADDGASVEGFQEGSQRVGDLARHRVTRDHEVRPLRRVHRHKAHARRVFTDRGAKVHHHGEVMAAVPELDANAGGMALGLLAGATLLVFDQRRRRPLV